MNYIGIDYHKQYSHVTAVNKEGHILHSQRRANDILSLQAFFAELDGPSRGGLEASRTWGTRYAVLVGLEGVAGVTLAHAQKRCAPSPKPRSRPTRSTPRRWPSCCGRT